MELLEKMIGTLCDRSVHVKIKGMIIRLVVRPVRIY